MAISGKFLADFASFEAAVQKAEVSLKGFEGDANKVAGSMTRMGNSLQGTKLIQDATLMAAAVDKIGGVSKLTETELQRVATQAQEAAAKMRALGIGVPENLQKIADAAKTTESPLRAMGTSVTTLVASFVTAQAIIGGVKEAWGAFTGFLADSVKAAGDAEKAHVQLVAALHAQGTAIPSVITAFGGYAAALQKTTIYQDDAIEGAEALLVQVGSVMPRDMERALKATTDLASGLGKDLTDATMLVAKAAEGNIGALKKAGIVIDETKAKQEGFGYVLDQITAKFGGQAAAVAGTYQGRIAQLTNTWNDVQESVGRVITTNETLLALFGYVNTAVGDNTKELNANKTAANFVSDAVITSVRGVALFIDAIDKINLARAGFVVTAKALAIGLEGVALAAAYAAKGVDLASGNIGGYRQATVDIATIEASMAALKASTGDTVQGTIVFGNALADIRTKAEALAKHLEETRGKTVTLADATDSGAHAWDRHTTSLAKATGAAADAAKHIADLSKEIVGANAANFRPSEMLEKFGKAAQDAVQDARIFGIAVTKALGDMADAANTADYGKAVLKHNALIKKDFDDMMKDKVASMKRVNDAIAANLSIEVAARLATDDAIAKNTLSATQYRVYQIEHEFAAKRAQLDQSLGESRAYEAALEQLDADRIASLNLVVDADWEAAHQMMAATSAGMKNIPDAATGIQELTTAFTQLATISGSSFGGAAQEIGKLIGAVNLLATAYQHAAKAATDAGQTAAAAASAGTGAAVTQLATFGMTTLITLLGDAQAKSDALNTAIATLKFSAAAHFSDLTRAMGAYADSYIDAIKNARTLQDANEAVAAMQHQLDLHAAAKSQFGPSANDLLDLADTAREVYEQMKNSGQYTADQLAAAFEASAAAQRRALTDTKDGALNAANAAAKAGQAFADQAAAAGYQTQAELQQAADQAGKLFEYMRDSGLFTSAQVADAFDKANEAHKVALGQDSKAIDELKSKYKSLSESVSQEAPEDVMGVIETQMRGQMAALDEEIKRASGATAQTQTDAAAAAATDSATVLKRGADDYAKYADTTYGGAMTKVATDAATAAGQMKDSFATQAHDAAVAIVDQFNDLTVHVKVIYDVPDLPGGGSAAHVPLIPMASGGSGTAWTPTLFLAGEHGAEPYAFGSATRSTGGSDQTLQAILEALARLPRSISRSVKDSLAGVNG